MCPDKIKNEVLLVLLCILNIAFCLACALIKIIIHLIQRQYYEKKLKVLETLLLWNTLTDFF